MIFLILVAIASAANILVLNHNHGHSHVRFLGNLADMLAKDGHNVTILSPLMDEAVVPHGTDNPEITKIIHRSPYFKNLADDLEMKTPSFWDLPEPDGMTVDWSVWDAFTASFFTVYRGLLEDKELISRLQASKFELAVTETFEHGGSGLFEILGIKTMIAGASLGVIHNHYTISGLPNLISFVPYPFATYGDDMTFLERLKVYQMVWQWDRHEKKELDEYNQLFQEFYPDLPSLDQLADKQLGIVLVNSNEFVETPRPRVNMFQYIGGVHVREPQPLDEKIGQLLELRPSTVYFSLGSFILTCQMPLALKIQLLEAFASFPDVTFLWKYEKCDEDTAPLENYPNVIARPWWPQLDLLGDDRVKAFITHAGMNSLLEVSYRGKPTITIPLFGDQFVNAKAVVGNGMSVMIRRTELSKKTMSEGLKKVLDPKGGLAKNSRMAAKVLAGKGDEYRKEALRWTRLLAEFGPMPHHRLASKNMNYWQITGLDIVAAICLPSVVVALSIVFLFCSCRKVKRREKSD